MLSSPLWLAGIAGFDAMTAEWEAWIDKQNPPARATVEAKPAGQQAKVEIAIIAAVGDCV